MCLHQKHFIIFLLLINTSKSATMLDTSTESRIQITASANEDAKQEAFLHASILPH